MTEMIDILRGIAAPVSRLDDAAISGLSTLDGLVLRSKTVVASGYESSRSFFSSADRASRDRNSSGVTSSSLT